jgi:hypothetical protein
MPSTTNDHEDRFKSIERALAQLINERARRPRGPRSSAEPRHDRTERDTAPRRTASPRASRSRSSVIRATSAAPTRQVVTGYPNPDRRGAVNSVFAALRYNTSVDAGALDRAYNSVRDPATLSSINDAMTACLSAAFPVVDYGQDLHTATWCTAREHPATQQIARVPFFQSLAPQTIDVGVPEPLQLAASTAYSVYNRVATDSELHGSVCIVTPMVQAHKPVAIVTHHATMDSKDQTHARPRVIELNDRPVVLTNGSLYRLGAAMVFDDRHFYTIVPRGSKFFVVDDDTPLRAIDHDSDELRRLQTCVAAIFLQPVTLVLPPPAIPTGAAPRSHAPPAPTHGNNPTTSDDSAPTGPPGSARGNDHIDGASFMLLRQSRGRKEEPTSPERPTDRPAWQRAAIAATVAALSMLFVLCLLGYIIV